MANKDVITFTGFTKDQEELVGNDTGDLYNKDALTAALPQNGFLQTQSATTEESEFLAFGFIPRCPCECACAYFQDINLGDIDFEFIDDAAPAFQVNETYTRISLFDIFDGVVTDFGDVDNKYVAWITYEEDSTSKICKPFITTYFTQVGNGEGAGGVGIGAGTIGLNTSSGLRTFLLADWHTSGYPLFFNGSGTFSQVFDPDPPYPAGPNFHGTWESAAGSGFEWNLQIASHIITGFRPITGDEVFPAAPSGSA